MPAVPGGPPSADASPDALHQSKISRTRSPTRLEVVVVDDDLARPVRRHAPLVGGVREGDGAGEPHVVRGPGRLLLADALEPMHRAGDLRERVLDGVGGAIAVDRLPSPADALDAPALDLDHHHAELGMSEDDVGLAVSRLRAWPFLKPTLR